jgi:DNA-directed RNA polymerase specialized sigma24 family protein
MDLASDVVERGEGWDAGDSFDVDAFNAETLAASAALSFGEARLALDDARNRLRTALASLPAPSDGAKEAFSSSTVEHYEEHLAMLRRLTGSTQDVP